MLSMFVGAIIASMSESIAAINQERETALQLKKEASKRSVIANMKEVCATCRLRCPRSPRRCLLDSQLRC